MPFSRLCFQSSLLLIEKNGTGFLKKRQKRKKNIFFDMIAVAALDTVTLLIDLLQNQNAFVVIFKSVHFLDLIG